MAPLAIPLFALLAVLCSSAARGAPALLDTAATVPTPITYEICTSDVFCYGDLLHTVQMARIHNDSKTFVDMKLQSSPEHTYANFRAWQAANPEPSRDDVARFVAANFDPAGSEFQPYTPADFQPQPAFLQRIADPDYGQWAGRLNAYWPQLGRSMTDDVARHPERYSIIPLPHPVIVPGGRFREVYYWDSYWIVLGLLHSEMHHTVRGMLANFVSIVERYGFVPNGGRVYYLGRSQPPLLIPMIAEYARATGDWAFVGQSLPALEREFAYWFDASKAVRVAGHTLSRYTDRSPGPRPESYWEDWQLAQQFAGADERARFYGEMKAGAESGMDYTTRWFVRNGTNNGTLADLQCSQLVPVELNAVLQWNAELLAAFHAKVGAPKRTRYFGRRARELRTAVQAVFWHEDVGAWLDWDLVNEQRRDYFVPTNLAPLWTGTFERADSKRIAAKVMAYIARHDLDRFAAGVPNTLVESGEQWDFPNVWPPMQHMLIAGLERLGVPEASATAFEWASKWVFTNYVAYNATQSMFEKYSAVEIGLGGQGGEYEVQLGFGWSNGVVLDLLNTYGDRLTTRSKN